VADEDLEELARLAASARQFLVTLVLAIVFAGVVGGTLVRMDTIPPKVIAGAVIAAVAVAAAIGLRVRTPPGRFPTIRALRDRAGEIAHVVSIRRGKQFIALAGSDGRLLASPLVLKGSLQAVSVYTANAAAREESAQAARALAIIARRCPGAKTAKITDHVGLSSLAKLVKKAIEAS
jgi:hypothetical protein